jgi:hypothetical protein
MEDVDDKAEPFVGAHGGNALTKVTPSLGERVLPVVAVHARQPASV